MLNLGSFSIHIYGLLIGLGMIAALEVSIWFGKKKNVSRQIIDKGFWWIITAGLIGARIYHVIDYWNRYYSNHIMDIFAIWNGGLGIWGGIIGGAIGFCLFYLYLKHKEEKQNILLYADIATLGIPLAQAIGRWGNFFNRELFGKPTNLPWGILNNQSVRVHPLFIYESALNLALFMLMIKIAQHTKKLGILTGTYLIGYGFIRLILETLRPLQTVWTLNGIPTAQIMSIAAILLGTLLYKKAPDERGH